MSNMKKRHRLLAAAKLDSQEQWLELKDKARSSSSPFAAGIIDGVATLRNLNANAEIVEAAQANTGPGTLRMKCAPYGEYGMFAFGELKLEPGYFTRSLANIAAGAETAFVFGDAHQGMPAQILASTSATGDRARASFSERPDGLYAEVVLADTQTARDIAELVSQGALDECSIGWRFNDMDAIEEEDEDRYTSPEGTLREVSMVDRGAFVGNTEVFMATQEKADSDATAEVSPAEVLGAAIAKMTEANVAALAKADATIKELEAKLEAQADGKVETIARDENGTKVVDMSIARWRQQTGAKSKEGHHDRQRHLAAGRKPRR